MPDDLLPSWRPGPTRDALVAFLDDVLDVPTEERVACLDNDGTLWCERPSYVQLDFFVDTLRSRASEPDFVHTPEFDALLGNDTAAMGELGLERIALALTSLCQGISPEEFTSRVRAFMSVAQHPTLGRPLLRNVYQPMLELIDELRRRDVTVTIVTGGGTEFVRAVSQQLYGVPPEAVVGTLIGYELSPRRGRGTPPAQDRSPGRRRQRGRRQGEQHPEPAGPPTTVLVAGNSGGDREMLEWAASGPGPTLALLIDHDDAGARVRLREPRRDVRRAGADHRGRCSAGVDGGQHGDRLGDRLPVPDSRALGGRHRCDGWGDDATTGGHDRIGAAHDDQLRRGRGVHPRRQPLRPGRRPRAARGGRPADGQHHLPGGWLLLQPGRLRVGPARGQRLRPTTTTAGRARPVVGLPAASGGTG